MSAYPVQTQAAAECQASTLCVSLELSKKRWVITVSAPGSDKFSRHDLPGGDAPALLDLLRRLQAAARPAHGRAGGDRGHSGGRARRLLDPPLSSGVQSGPRIGAQKGPPFCR